MEIKFRPFGQAGRALALITLFGAGVATLNAQTTAPALNLQTPAASTSATPEFSSSAPDNELAVSTEHFNFAGINAMQYGGRQRSGRPRYRGGNTNADGSEKYYGFGGVGLTIPTQDTKTYNKPSWAFGFGAGRNFNKHVGVQVEFNYDNFGLQGSTLANQVNLYNYGEPTANQIPPGYLDGSAHVWSFGITPVYSVYSDGRVGAYVLGGVGFYHKVTDFTIPETGTYCDYACYEYTANAIFDHYTSNAPGLNGGLGLTYKFSHFSNERFYAEARYVYIFNSYRPGVTSADSPATLDAYNGWNLYPANSQRTSYIPIKFGIRF